MNNIKEFESAYNTYMERDVRTPVGKFKHPVPSVTYKYQHANNMLAFWNAARDGVIAQLEAAQKRIKELESKVNHYVAAEYAHKHFDQTAEIIKRADSAELELVKAEAALSAANEKLKVPVKLPKKIYLKSSKSNVISWSKTFDAIEAAGFTVEGE